MIGAGSTRAYTENAAAVTLESGLTVTDADDTQIASGSVTISAGFTAGDTLTWTGVAPITASYNSGTGVLTLSGTTTLANYQTLLRSVAYSSSSDDPTVNGTRTSRTVTWSLTDANSDAAGAGTGIILTTVNITAVNDAPVVASGCTLNYTENGAAAAINTVITVADLDNPTLASGTVSITGRLRQRRGRAVLHERARDDGQYRRVVQRRHRRDDSHLGRRHGDAGAVADGAARGAVRQHSSDAPRPRRAR